MLRFTLFSLVIWGIAIQTTWAQGGQSCNNSVTAQQGLNISDNSLGDQWFKYTASTNGKVTVSSCGQTTADTYVEILDGCNEEAFTFSNDYCNKQSEVSFEVRAGLTYQICWRARFTNKNFEWFLTESPSQQGEFCSMPIAVGAGSSNVTIPVNQYKWYAFTASRTGKITVEAVPSCKVAIFDNCNYTTSLNNDENWNPNKTAFEGVSGQTYLVALFNAGTKTQVNLSITEGDWQAGERCDKAIDVANLNKAAIDHESGTDKWYRFIAFEDGDVTISAVGLTNQDTYLEVYEGCGKQRVAFNDDASGMQSELVLNVKANKAYYIKWDNIFEPLQYAWNLKAGNYATSMPEQEESNIGVYPNPSQGPVTFDLRGFESETVTVSVMSVTGAVVKVLHLPGGVEANYDLSDLNNGIYQIVLQDLVSKKVVKFLKK